MRVFYFLKNLGIKDAGLRTVGNGVNQIPDMSFFTDGPGWQKLPSGLIIQWYVGRFLQAGAVNFNFPIPFPNRFLVDACMPGGSGAVIINGGMVTNTFRQLHSTHATDVAVITLGF